MSRDPSMGADVARWRGLFVTAGVGALLTALCLPLQIAIYIVAPPPASREVAAWFDLFSSSPLLGLVSLDLLMMVEQVLLVPVALALAALVYRRNASLTVLGTALWLAGAVLIVGANTGFEMLSLARGYAAATTDAARAAYLAAGQGMLASYFDMGTGFVFGYLLTSLGGILVGVAMIRARLFGRVAGSALVAGDAVGLLIFVPGIGIGLSLGSVVILWFWYALMGVGLLRLVLRSTRQAPSEAARATAAAAAS